MTPPVVAIAVAYGAGLWVGLVVLVPSRVGMMLALGLALVVAGRRLPAAAAFALLGVAAGEIAALGKSRSCQATWPAGHHAAVLSLDDRPSRRGLTTGFIRFAPEGCGGRVRLRFDTSEIPAGARLIVAGTFRAPEVLSVRRFRVLSGARSWRFTLREAAGRRVDRLYGERAPLVEALILGRREDLAPPLRGDFAAAGLAHLLAISGLHVGILAGWCSLVLRKPLGRRRALVGGTIAAWVAVIRLGVPPPASRAAAFLTIQAIARWRQRHPPPGVVLAVAVLVVVAVDPAAVTSVGAWLSAAAVWGSGAGVGMLSDRLRRSAPLSLLARSAGATAVTAPITAYVFGAVAPIGVLANLVAIPLAAVAVPAVFVSLGAGWMASGAGLALAATERTAGLAAAVPGGHLAGEPGVRFALPCALVLGALLWARHRRPTWLVARRRLLAGAAATSWALAVLAAAPQARRATGLEIDVLDVGQGDAIAIRSPGGRWILIDAGPRTPLRDAGRATVLPFFRRRGVRRLDVLIASHGDADHLGGVPAVLRALQPDLVLEPGQPVGTPLYLDYLAAVDQLGLQWRPARAGDTLFIDSLTLAVLHPTGAWVASHFDTNENSVIVRLTYGAFDALFVGDAGWLAESLLAPAVPETEVLKVGHHGSEGSTSDRWLDALRPRAAVISVGENRYGHPAPGALARLSRRGVELWRTDRGGTVTIESDGRYFSIRQTGSTMLRERLRCLQANWLPSSASSSNRNACTGRPPVSFPTSSTTSRSPPRSFPGTSGRPASSTSSAAPGDETFRERTSRNSTFSPTTP